jgi:NAD-dependent deacetylase
MATQAAFRQMPDEVWRWYLYRRSVCRRARPNPAHTALVRVEQRHGDRFVLVTQNVDGLHLRAGNSLERTWQIHGNIDYMRCVDECGGPVAKLLPIRLPDAWAKDQPLDDAREALVCPDCGGATRPHVLWFDESYNEALYRFESSLRAAMTAALLVVVGTSGTTNLPIQMGEIAERRGIPFIVINPDTTPFTRMADRSPEGLFLGGTAGHHLPVLTDLLL